MNAQAPFAVLGAGSWGTALAVLLARNGHRTLLWGREMHAMTQLAGARCNARYLPGVKFPERLVIEPRLEAAVRGAAAVLVVVPSHGFRELLQRLRPHLPSGARLVWATKGLETGSGKLLHEVAEEVLGSAVEAAVMSGPTFAREVAAGLPTAITVASTSAAFATDLAERFHNDTFRAYTSEDMIGVGLGGAVKNVLAIAAGIADGLGYGANSRAALITRGLAEMMRLGRALGGDRETFMGLAGLGDLVLTCTDDQSRNRRMGLALARGERLEEALDEIDQVVEGVQAAREVSRLAARAGVEMPICEQVCRVLYETLPPRDAVHALLTRELKPERL